MIDIFVIVASAIVVEALMEVFKSILEPKEIPAGLIRLLTVAIGIGFAANFNLQLLATFGFVGMTPIVDMVATGILVGGGSNLAYDMIQKLQEKREELDENNSDK